MPRLGRAIEPGGTGPWFTARYDGECADCGFPIEYGETICADGYGDWLCEDCGEKAKERERKGMR